MIKQCVILDEKIINVGEWNDGGLDKDGKPINPMPSGATIEDRDLTYSEDKGWYDSNISRAEEIKARLVEIDLESVRPLRAKVNNVATEEDNTKLINLESEATTLRTELATLNI